MLLVVVIGCGSCSGQSPEEMSWKPRTISDSLSSRVEILAVKVVLILCTSQNSFSHNCCLHSYKSMKAEMLFSARNKVPATSFSHHQLRGLSWWRSQIRLIKKRLLRFMKVGWQLYSSSSWYLPLLAVTKIQRNLIKIKWNQKEN